jgi:hypothetical protein
MKIYFLFPLFLLFSFPVFGQEVKILSEDLNNLLNVRDYCHSADGKEEYFTVQSPNQELSQIVVVKNGDRKNPQLLPFCNAFSYLEPFLTTDGKRLYFASDRPKSEKDSAKSDFDIWYVERKNLHENWSKPINAGAPINSENDEFYPAVAQNGNLYFTMDAKEGMGKDDIYFCKKRENTYEKPVLLGKNINSEGYEFNAFISKDENLLIFTKYNTKDGFGSGDLYFSTKDKNGEWQAAENLGNKINTKFMEYCPFYDAQSEILYFTSRRAALKTEIFENFEQYIKKISGSENGLSRIYQCKIKLNR